VLGSVISHHVSQYHTHDPTFKEKLLDSLYVDDLVTSAPDVESGYKFFLESKRVMADGGMNLRKWHSNSLELLERINSDSQESDQKQVPTPSQLVEEDDMQKL